jgi:hypothetical protein
VTLFVFEARADQEKINVPSQTPVPHIRTSYSPSSLQINEIFELFKITFAGETETLERIGDSISFVILRL